MKILLTSVWLIFAATAVQADAVVIKEQWGKQDLSADERDELVELSKNEPFHSIAPILVPVLLGFPPQATTTLLGDKPWNRDEFDSEGRKYWMADAVWKHHTFQDYREDPPEGKVLLSLLRHAESQHEKRFLIRALMHYCWVPSAEVTLAKFANEGSEHLGVRRQAAEALLWRCDINIYMPKTIEIILNHESGLPRLQAFSHTMPGGNRLSTLSPSNRRVVLSAGFDMLSDLRDADLQHGYSVARDLGSILKVENKFSPKQGAEKYHDKHGLNDAFFIDTVKNALDWHSKNDGNIIRN